MNTLPRHRSIAAIAAAAVLLASAPAANAQDDDASPGASPSISPAGVAMPEPADDSAPVRYSVIGPVDTGAKMLLLVLGERSCGVGSRDAQYSDSHVVETATEILIRVDVLAGPQGEACLATSPIRVPVVLSDPVADRLIRDAGSADGATPTIHEVDPIDTGYRYTCGTGSMTVADLMGPGLDLEESGPPVSDGRLRAIVDGGDFIEYLGPFPMKGDSRYRLRLFLDGRWTNGRPSGCRPSIAVRPGEEVVTWKLRGKRPSPRSRQIRISATGTACASGRSVAGRTSPPLVQVRRDSIVITITAARPRGVQDCQGLASAPLVVDLPVRLGDRKLYDGSVFPPKERRGRR